MKHRLLQFLLINILLTNTNGLTACTIFMANDNQNVWIGNNEDELSNKKYRMWYYPAAKEHYGYTIWSELMISPLVYGLMYKFPQGGLNEYGLFMDYTAIDNIPALNDPTKKNRKKQVVTDVLKKCKTVKEALDYIDKYNLIRLTGAQLFIGDASGDYATVHGSYIVRKTSQSFALTNYCINKDNKEACWRRDAANHNMNTLKTYQLEDIKSILERSTQKSPNAIMSNYSMAVNLKTNTIHLFYKNDFKTEALISLTDELKKGKHHKDIVEYFPKNVANLIEKMNTSKGIKSAVDTYDQLRKTEGETYNFKNNDVLNLAIQWIDKKKTKDAIQLLECLKNYEPTKTDIYTWLGVAYRIDNNLSESQTNFSKALELNPHDYLTTLWGKQENQKVIFKLNDFEDAEEVSLMGEFTEWEKKPIKMIKENGVWNCQVTLPKGENQYKFLVNKSYECDTKNWLYIVLPDRTRSKLYVW